MSPETKALQRVMQDYFDWHKARIAFISAFILSLTKLRKRQFYETGKRAQWQASSRSLTIVVSNVSLPTLTCRMRWLCD